MVWYVEVTSPAHPVAARPRATAALVDAAAAAVLGGVARPRTALLADGSAGRLVQIDASTWATLTADVIADPASRRGSRVVVRGCFWGDSGTPGITAPPQEARGAAQAHVNARAKALHTHLSDRVRTPIAGSDLN